MLYKESESIKTSRKQIAKIIINNKEKLKDSVWLNFGCGKYSDLTYNLLNGFHYDPFLTNVNNYNFNDINKIPCKRFDYVVCANVLNVLQDDSLLNTLLTLESLNTDSYLISIYEGDKTGNGKITKHGTYQRNDKTINYLTTIENVFTDYVINIKSNEIYITKQK
tara:strand:+ start:19 stop:513 length:495 start_codon:yes stop_codon:yes gene_type:complete